MSVAAVLAMVVGSAILASGADLHGTWAASSTSGQRLAGGWTVAQPINGAVTGTWSLFDASGKTVIQGGWSANKAAWRATVLRQTAEYSGTWAASKPLPAEAGLAQMFVSALAAVVTGTWDSGGSSGSWSIRAYP